MFVEDHLHTAGWVRNGRGRKEEGRERRGEERKEEGREKRERREGGGRSTICPTLSAYPVGIKIS